MTHDNKARDELTEEPRLRELCYIQKPGTFLACDREMGHQGLHTWEVQAHIDKERLEERLRTYENYDALARDEMPDRIADTKTALARLKSDKEKDS